MVYHNTGEPGMRVTSTYIVFREGFPEELQIEGNIGIQAITAYYSSDHISNGPPIADGSSKGGSPL